jgi:hypothetical protein
LRGEGKGGGDSGDYFTASGRVRVGGQKSPKVRSSCHLEKAFLPPELKDTKNILEKFFAKILTNRGRDEA